MTTTQSTAAARDRLTLTPAAIAEAAATKEAERLANLARVARAFAAMSAR